MPKKTAKKTPPKKSMPSKIAKKTVKAKPVEPRYGPPKAPTRIKPEPTRGTKGGVISRKGNDGSTVISLDDDASGDCKNVTAKRNRRGTATIIGCDD